jgi:hypothetical protein
VVAEESDLPDRRRGGRYRVRQGLRNTEERTVGRRANTRKETAAFLFALFVKDSRRRNGRRSGMKL